MTSEKEDEEEEDDEDDDDKNPLRLKKCFQPKQTDCFSLNI